MFNAVYDNKGRNLILRAICPNVYGLFVLKLATALTLIGGVPKIDKQGNYKFDDLMTLRNENSRRISFTSSWRAWYSIGAIFLIK